MTIYRNSAEGGIDGANVTISNSGGLSGDPFSLVNESGNTDVLWRDASGLHGSKGIRIVPDGTNQVYVGYTFPALRLKTSLRFYFRLSALPSSGGTGILAYWSNTANTGQRLAIGVLSTGIVRITNAAVGVVYSSTVPLAVNTTYRMEVGVDIGAGTISFRVFLGENPTPITGVATDLTGQSIGGTSGAAHIFIGYRQVVVGVGALDIDDIMIDDSSNELLGPAGLAEIPLVAEYLGSGVVKLTFPMPSDATNGVSIVRAPGLITNDGNGNAPHHPEYNPLTVSGAVMRATNVLTTPYLDSGVPLGSWTYWVARTAA